MEFETEIRMLSNLQHKNISSILESYNRDNEKIIIYKGGSHGILDQHLCDPTLIWSRRLQICLGIARALNYIHYDVIHCNINTSKIILDEDWEPKIFGFELSSTYPQSWRHRLRFSQFFDSTSIITPKCDVYSYGVLLFEVLCGKKPMIQEGGVKEELDEIIDPNLKKQMDTQSLTLFLRIAYNCLNQQLVERPSMDQIVKELEEALELQWKHENLEDLADVEEGISSNRLKMDFLKIPLSEIRLATKNFDEENVVGYGGYGIVYRAKLDVLDIQSLSSVEGKCKDELPKKSKTVAIKRIFSRSDEQGKEGFLREIELLTSCKHSNIVSLLGFSREACEMILVYEYASKGSLSDYLGSTGKKINLTWSQRILICLDIAYGINYLHTSMEGKPRIIHRDIKSENILLDENLKAKVADFGLSKFHPTNQQVSTIYTKNIAGTEVYMDPEYLTTFKYKKESDIYSFGVVLFEILSGRLAYDSIYMIENDKGLAPVARRRFNEGTLKELIDPHIREEDDEQIFTLNRGPNQESFDSFSKIAYQCLAETQAKRPTMEAIIKELQYALKLQGETMVLSRFRLSDIAFATEHFSTKYCSGLDSNGMVYKAVLNHFDNKNLLATEVKNSGESPKRCISVAIKRISSRKDTSSEEGFFEEIEMHTSYKHPNIVPLLGFCDEGNDLILVFEHGSNRSLDDYLRGTDNMGKYTWTQRLHTCLEIARGLNHLHTMMDCKQGMIHVDIRSANILLGKNWEAKISYFGISKLLTANQEDSTDISSNTVSSKVYCDPEYEKTGELKKKSDIYSFGVVLFEIFCGRLAYDPVYMVGDDKGLAPIACRCFNDGTIKQIIDPALKEETDEDILPIQDSLETFLRIAYHCLAETGAERPTMTMVIKELETALKFQENLMKTLQVSIKDIKVATENFSQKHFVGRGRYWKMYKGEVLHANADGNANGCTTIIAKRWDSESRQARHQFRTELIINFKHKHENIISLVGYCNEKDERIIVYEHTSYGSLDMYLDSASLTWQKRLMICIDVANGLEFFHGGAVTLKKVVHRNIQCHAILLHDDWKAKISNLELSSLDSLPQDMEHVSNNAYGAFGYLDPEYKQGFLTEKSDIYSFGVVLFEILCGRLAWVEDCKDHSQSLGPLAKRKYQDGKIDEMVFDGIKEQIRPESLATFAEIAYNCLNDRREDRPMAGDVVLQLKKALDVQNTGDQLPLQSPFRSPPKHVPDMKLYKVSPKGFFPSDPVNGSVRSLSFQASDRIHDHTRARGVDAFRLSLSTAASSSTQGFGHDDWDALGVVFLWGEITGDGGPHKIGSSIGAITDSLLPKALESATVLDAQNIACGGRHTALVTKQGEIFSWGEEFGGRLGHGVDSDFLCPKLVESLSNTKIKLVACGEYHTCAVTLSGELYTWGDGQFRNLGHGNEVSHWVPKQVKGPLEGIHVSFISCGSYHTAVVTSAGQLFTFGDGTFGVLGHGDQNSVLKPREVESLKGLRTVRAACGVWHTAAVVEVMVGNASSSNCSSGKLFTWGDGNKYRLGHGDKVTKLVPTCVAALVDPNFCQVKCGNSMTVALTTSGHVYTMGSPVYGQLGNPQADGRLPTRVEGKLSKSFVEEISCGAYHVALLTSRTKVYTWGKGSNGRLGHGDIDDRNSPTLVKALKDKQVKTIACGTNFTAAICAHKWVSGTDQSICSGCHLPFSFKRKRHNCYNCGLVFCHSCSSKKSLRASMALNSNKPSRVCDNCVNKLKKSIEADVSSQLSVSTGRSVDPGMTEANNKDDKSDPRFRRSLETILQRNKN